MAPKNQGLIIAGLALGALFLFNRRGDGGLGSGGGGFGAFGGFPLPAQGVVAGPGGGGGFTSAVSDEDIGVGSPGAAPQSSQNITSIFRSPTGRVTGPVVQPRTTRQVITTPEGGITRNVPVAMASQQFAANVTQFRNTLGSLTGPTSERRRGTTTGIQPFNRTQQTQALQTQFRDTQGNLSFNTRQVAPRPTGTTTGIQPVRRTQATQARGTQFLSPTGRRTGPSF